MQEPRLSPKRLIYRMTPVCLLRIMRQKSVGYLLRGTRPSGASHKRYPTLIYRSLLHSAPPTQCSSYTVICLSMASDAMQVWFVSTQRAWGGGEVYLRHLAAGLREQNIDVRFAAPKHSPLAGQMASEGFPVFGFDGRGRNPRTLWQLRSRLRSTPQTIVHCNDSHALTLGGLASLGLANTKTIAMRHTMFPIRSPGKYHRLADRTICVSNAVAQQCVADGLQRNTLSVVHVGIPSPVVDPATVARLRQSVCGPDQRLIVAVGNLLECKGHAALIAAVDALQSPTNRLVLAIAGEGKHRDALERQIAGLRYPGAIRLLGFQTNPHEWLAAADLVAHPSLQEGLCLTVV